jgi:hypothetical protein
MRILTLAVIALSLLFITGCRTVMVVPAPPPHPVYLYPPLAPAPGYRYHYHGHDLEYDNGLGAYVVLGYNGIYFYNRLYLRFVAGEWEVTDRLNHTWRRAQARNIPDRLRHHERFKRYRKPPPPHAPAHGYRYHYQDHDMQYDSRIGAYIILGIGGLYFYNNLYMRYYDGYWHYSNRPNGTWHRARDRDIPQKLRTYQRQRIEQDRHRRNGNGLINNIRQQQLRKEEERQRQNSLEQRGERREERREHNIPQQRHEERVESRHQRPGVTQQNQRRTPPERKPAGQRTPTKPGLFNRLKEKQLQQQKQPEKGKAKKKGKNKHDKSKKDRDKKDRDKDNKSDENRDDGNGHRQNR